MMTIPQVFQLPQIIDGLEKTMHSTDKIGIIPLIIFQKRMQPHLQHLNLSYSIGEGWKYF